MADETDPKKPLLKRLPVRWLTLAEGVGLLALVIAGLGYWDSHRERSEQDNDRAAAARERQADRQAERQAGALKQTFLMTGQVTGEGEHMRLATLHPEQVIQTQTLWFPSDIRDSSVETTGNPRLEAGWIQDGLDRVASKAKSGRMPVGILTVYIEDGQTKSDRAIYYVGYTLHPRMLRHAKVELEGLSIARRGAAGDLQTAAGALWSAN